MIGSTQSITVFEQAKQTLSNMLAPFSYDQFFNEVIGRKPLALLNDDRANRAGLLGNQAEQTILKDFETLAPSLTCHSDKPTLPQPQARNVTSESAFRELIREYHSKNYTVRIPNVTSLSTELQNFIRALDILFGNPAEAVIFWSQAGLKAPIHYDASDIICIQLTGRKTWYISNEPPSLANQWKKLGEGPPPLDNFNTIEVGPGDLLYLPRGTPHTVSSPKDSIHLSIGFVPVTLRDAVAAALDHFSDLQIPLRAGVTQRADDLAQGKGMDVVTAKVKDALARLTTMSQYDDFIQDAMNLRQSRMIVELPKLAASEIPDNLNVRNHVRRNTQSIAKITPLPENINFSQPGHHILVHAGAEVSLRFMTETKEFVIGDIPGDINDDVRIALTSRLLNCGFLEVVL